MPWYPALQRAIKISFAFLAQTQAINLALLVSALLTRQTLCLSELARAYPRPSVRRVTRPKHDLLSRLKRLWRFREHRAGRSARGPDSPYPLDNCSALLAVLARLGNRLDDV